MAESKKEAVIKVVGEKPAKKTAAKKETVANEAAVETKVEVAATQVAEPAKKPAKKAAKAKAPLYINGRYVVEKQLPAKPAKGEKPYEEAKKQIKVTLIKSTAGCLKDQQATVKALGLDRKSVV